LALRDEAIVDRDPEIVPQPTDERYLLGDLG